MVDDLEALTTRLRALAPVGAAIAEAARAPVEAIAHRTVAAGTAPDGTAWAPTKAGTPPLRGAAKAVSVEVSGATLVLVLRGHHTFHQRGTKSLPRRPIVPETDLPEEMREAVRTAAASVVARTVEGA